MEFPDFSADQEMTNLDSEDKEIFGPIGEKEECAADLDEDLVISDSDDDGKEDIPCVCGNKNHKNLKKWYEDYLLSGYTRKLRIFEDKLNQIALERKIQSLLPQVPICNNFCPSCQNLSGDWPEINNVPQFDIDQLTESYHQPHFKNTLEFEAGYRNGCRLCALFIQCSSRDYSFETWHAIQSRLECLGKSTVISISMQRNESGDCELQLTSPGLTTHYSPLVDTLYCARKYDQQQFNIGNGRTPLPIDPLTSGLNLAKKWLDNCSEIHESCKSTQYYDLPTRLIDVGSTPIRIVLTSTFATKPRYATLSHCWGTNDFLKLQEDSLESFMTAIPEDKLTKTFRDAIYITRSLDLRYLWIDSLCIIQLSPLDWLRESALMSSVYGGSAINIAATGAVHGNEGCFLKPPGFVGRVHIQLTRHEEWDIAPLRFYKSVIKSPLASRAWTLQEHLLSIRTLHFSKTGLFWECRHCEASESFPEGLPQFEHRYWFDRGGKLLSETWNIIVGLYSAAKLTYRSDKMVAISGIAKQVQKENQDQYLAGLWRKNMESQLLWHPIFSEIRLHPVFRETRLPRRSEYHAPSWSWASVDSSVHFYSKKKWSTEIYYAHVTDAHVVPEGNDPFEELVGGVLRMSCSVMLVGKPRKDQPIEIESPGGNKKEFHVHLDEDEYRGQDIYILPVIKVFWLQRSPWEVSGLLLLPTGNQKGEYIRIGHLSFYNYDEEERKLQKQFLKLLKQSGKAIAEANCAEILSEPKYPNEPYVITII